MAFSQAGISGVAVQADGPDLLISWSATAPPGTIFQVYVDRRLNWYGASRRCHAPIPAGASGRNVWVDVATVGAGEAPADFSSLLASIGSGGGRVELTWLGGTYLDPSGSSDIRGFRIYRSPTPGAPVDLSAPIDEASRLFAAIEQGADIAIGSRWLATSRQTHRQPLYRQVFGRVLMVFANAMNSTNCMMPTGVLENCVSGSASIWAIRHWRGASRSLWSLRRRCC